MMAEEGRVEITMMEERLEDTTSPPSEVSSATYSSASSPYFRRRYDGKNTSRREALERIKGKSPRNSTASLISIGESSSDKHTRMAAPQIPDCHLEFQTPPRLSPKKDSRFPMDVYGQAVGRVKEGNFQRMDDEKAGPPSGETTITTMEASFFPESEKQNSSQDLCEEEEPSTMDRAVGDSHHEPTSGTEPQHLQLADVRYYRIVYRGVVALLSEPSTTSKRSGTYVSYGEIIQSSKEIVIDGGQTRGPLTPRRPTTSLHRLGAATRSPILSEAWQNHDCPDSPPGTVLSQTAVSESSLDTLRTSSTFSKLQQSSGQDERKAIQVDKVLTGGYAIDALDQLGLGLNAQSSIVHACDQTPKRGNLHPLIPIVGPSPLPISDSLSASNSFSSTNLDQTSTGPNLHGYLITKRNDVIIAETIDRPPTCEAGRFLYKVISSTPLPILTGPCMDAPKTKAMLLPGTIHEVCLRLLEENDHVYFLRLSRRKGWIADRKIVRGSKFSSVPAMKEISNEHLGDDGNISVLSATTSSVATPVSTARRRHRPPRRRREAAELGISLLPGVSMPRHVPGPTRHEHYPNIESAPTYSSHDKGIMSPSSNVSMLSDESSMEHDHNANKSLVSVTPDRHASRSSVLAKQPSFFLMRVNAPRGLKILDAPHFQVNNLIHGTSPHVPSPQGMSKDLTGQMGNQSIFQTMAGHHTTTLTSKIGNPAIFDSITKARKLPRGTIFEASRRMECSGAFTAGAGLIKLSDNSGWAIVPRQDELDDQYRNYHGALSGVKEGEATRAFEEVGNAIIDERQHPICLRVLSKGGVSVSLPPPTVSLSDDDTSPTSSATGSSVVSGGANGFSQVLSQDSDVASSVGSSFLDSMFRTPKKKDIESDSRKEGANRKNPNPPPVERLPVSTIIPCGMCIEVERWADSSDVADQNPHRHDYVRLRGGQGWVPRQINGKPLLETVPPPDFRFGSFWFRVQSGNGIKVRLGPSRRAPSIKSDDGVYFRFECGEFLRASEVMTVFDAKNSPSECFAKLYRNRHVRLYAGHGEVRQLASLTVQAEWVQVFNEEELFLEECAAEPRIERHRQGWRYNVVLDARVQVRKGPSFLAEANGVVLLGGESVLINERVTGPGETITWLRLKDGQGWVHNIGSEGEALMIPHSLRHRTAGRPSKPGKDGHEDIAYNTIIARLFHSDLPDGNHKEINNVRR